MSFWKEKRVLVTGGASFIGSHLVDTLVETEVISIRVVDDLSSGRLENIQGHLDSGHVEFVLGDLLQSDVAKSSVEDIDIVFHLAAIHGGRGFVDTHQVLCTQNLALDGLLFKAAYDAGVKKLVFASSGCVYPNYLQNNIEELLYLSEDMVGPPYDADNTYGWAKLMGELTLREYNREYGFPAASCRLFTVYGERGVENHAIIAMIARAFLRQNPFEVWGDGSQIRNWTYVGDIVRGLILSAEIVNDGSAVNLGTEERMRVIDAVHEVLRYTGHDAEIKFRPEMPIGPVNRVASNRLAKELLDWKPKVRFIDGLHRTIDWYISNRKRAEVQDALVHRLLER
jgi:nucleoside-diphosphate-sugar epimerase